MGLFLTFSVFELQRGYLYQNGVEFRQKVIGAGLNLFWGYLHYISGCIWTFPLLSVTYASAPIAERAILHIFLIFSPLKLNLRKPIELLCIGLIYTLFAY